jgi:hypothetical protein
LQKYRSTEVQKYCQDPFGSYHTSMSYLYADAMIVTLFSDTMAFNLVCKLSVLAHARLMSPGPSYLARQHTGVPDADVDVAPGIRGGNDGGSGRFFSARMGMPATTSRGGAATARVEEAATASRAAATGTGRFYGVTKAYGGRWIGFVHVLTLERALLPHHLQQKAQLWTLPFATQVEAARAVDRCADCYYSGTVVHPISSELLTGALADITVYRGISEAARALLYFERCAD